MKNSLLPGVLGFCLLAPSLFAMNGARQVLHGHVPAAVAQLQPVSPLPLDTNLNLALGLPLRNPQGLTNLLAQLYDPASPNYRHYLTPAEFTEQFGPTPAQYDAVIAFARTNGFKIVGKHPNRLLLDVRASVSDIQKAFNVQLRLYPHPIEPRTFYAPDAEPSVSAGLPILDVSGLDNFMRPHPKSLHTKRLDQSAQASSKDGSGPTGSYMGFDFRAAYVGGTELTGAGQTLGLIEFDGYYTNDITSYETLAGLPNVPLQNVLLDGFDGTPSSGNGEVALDIELSVSMAPGLAKILVYEADPAALPNDVISRMATDNLAAQLSCSWDFQTGPSATTEQIFQQFAAQGQSFFNASGDAGAYIGSIPIPDADPYITIVGGTTLSTTGPRGAWVSETTWNSGFGPASSGGFDPSLPIPVWQQGISMTANKGSTAARNIPDVSMVADSIFRIADNGTNEFVIGTSCAAPLWAAYTALINQKATAAGHGTVGFINPALYALAKGPNYSSYFHDITTGSNTNNTSPTAYIAVSGFDLCTGWGTPSGTNLLNALAIPDALGVIPNIGLNANGPVGGPFTVSKATFTITNSGAASQDWTAGGTASWFDVLPSAGTLGPGAGTTITVSLNAAANLLAAGTLNAAVGFTNLTSQFVQTRPINLLVGSSLVLNGGFESGDFAYWTLSGVAADSFSFVDDGTSINPRSGNYVAALGQVGSLGTLTQSLPTLAGQPYLFTFWFSVVPDSTGLATPNVFRAVWNGKTQFAGVNLPETGWTEKQFIVTSSGSNTVLQFLSEDDNYFIGLDDVSVIPIPIPRVHPAILSNSSAQLTWNSLAGLSYQVQYKSDLSQTTWTNLGSPVVATGPSATFTDQPINTPTRYYRILGHL